MTPVYLVQLGTDFLVLLAPEVIECRYFSARILVQIFTVRLLIIQLLEYPARLIRLLPKPAELVGADRLSTGLPQLLGYCSFDSGEFLLKAILELFRSLGLFPQLGKCPATL